METKYDFDLILSDKVLSKNNKESIEKNIISNLNLESKNKRIKLILRIVKLFLLVVLTISIYQLFTVKTTNNTSAGKYECKGKLIQICTGNNNVKNYLGV